MKIFFYIIGGILGLGVLGYLLLSATMRGRITSWWRTPWHNLSIGGVPSSRHQLGLAFDISPGFESDGVLLRQVAAIIPTAKLVDERETKNHWHFQLI